MTNLRRHRLDRNLTQDGLALASGVTQATISRLERDVAAESGVTIDIARKLATALAVTVDDLFPHEAPSADVPAGQL
jgi:transcriptional regulator with XRE-family HTH domain